ARAQGEADRGRAVPPREHPHDARQGARRELGPRARAREGGRVSAPIGFPEVFARIDAGTLGPDDVRAAFGAILAGAWTPVQIGAFATALRLRGVAPEAIVAAAEALLAVMAPVDHDLDEVVDTCGTGGDGAHTLNVSTAAAIVVAACGVHVAKHGNRSVSSR